MVLRKHVLFTRENFRFKFLSSLARLLRIEITAGSGACLRCFLVETTRLTPLERISIIDRSL